MPGAAAAFHLVATTALRGRGEAATIARVAEVIGEHPNSYGRHVRGEVSPREARVANWCRAWAAAGYEPITLRVGPDGWAPT